MYMNLCKFQLYSSILSYLWIFNVYDGLFGCKTHLQACLIMVFLRKNDCMAMQTLHFEQRYLLAVIGEDLK